MLEYIQKNHQPSYSVTMKVIDKLIKAVINWGSKIILIGAEKLICRELMLE